MMTEDAMSTDAFTICPTLISRKTDTTLELAGLPAADGRRMLLVFMSPEQAETFRAETGRYPASEGFNVKRADLDGLEAVIEVWGYERVALRGPEPDTISEFSVEDFLSIMEDAGVERGL